jgi:hypothetical protein
MGARITALMAQPLEFGHAGGPHTAGGVRTASRYRLQFVRRLATVQQQQRVHLLMHRTRLLAAHHPQQVCLVRRAECRSSHTGCGVRADSCCSVGFDGLSVYDDYESLQ